MPKSILAFINFGLINHILNNNVQQNKNIYSSWASETGYYTLWNSEHREQTVTLHRTTKIYEDLGA